MSKDSKSDPPEFEAILEWFKTDPWVRGGLVVSIVVIIILVIYMATRR